jgi:hypothetical protein
MAMTVTIDNYRMPTEKRRALFKREKILSTSSGEKYILDPID